MMIDYTTRIWDPVLGRYRDLTPRELAIRHGAAVLAECEAVLRHVARRHELASDPVAWAAEYVPSSQNCNRVSYGRCQSRTDGTWRNWPQHLDGSAP